jgi:hypothetical protein
VLYYVVFSRADSVAHSPGRVVVCLVVLGVSSPGLQAGGSQMFHVHDFGGSKTTQAHAELILKFSALSFCSLDRGKKKGKRERERDKPFSRWTSLAAGSCSTLASRAVICYNELIKRSVFTEDVSPMCIGSILFSEKPDYQILATMNLKFSFSLMRALFWFISYLTLWSQVSTFLLLCNHHTIHLFIIPNLNSRHIK